VCRYTTWLDEILTSLNRNIIDALYHLCPDLQNEFHFLWHDSFLKCFTYGNSLPLCGVNVRDLGHLEPPDHLVKLRHHKIGCRILGVFFLLRIYTPALIKVGRRGSQSIHFCPLRQIKVGSFCFSDPVRRAGCGGLLVSTDCVRWRCAGPRFCVSLSPSPTSFPPRLLGIALKTLNEFP
jgi:hypothetical protein